MGNGSIAMFFLGHMCWAYIFGRLTGQLTSGKPQIQLSLICGILPDVDLLLHIEHGGIMHSIAFWIVAYIPILIWIGPRRGLPYLIATLQHSLFGDFLAGQYRILLSFSDRGYGLGLGLLSPITLSLEVLGFLILIACTFFTKELMSLFSDPINLLSSLPAVAMLATYGTILGVRRCVYGPPAFEAFQVLFMLIFFGSFLIGIVGGIRELHLAM
jgi:hypothetical protein